MTKENNELPSDKKQNRYVIPNLSRGLRVMEVLSRYPDGLSQADLAATLGVSTNSIFRIVVTLEKLGYANRNPETRTVCLTRKLLGLTHNALQEVSLVEQALPEMRKLRDRTGETVVLNILQGNKSVLLEQVPGTHPFRFAIDPGIQIDLHCSAHGKVILAFLDADHRDELLRKINLKQYTSTTITSKAALRKELESVHENGFAFDREEQQTGVCCISAPIFNHQGEVAGAITMTGPNSRLTSAVMNEFAVHVRKLANDISVKMGHNRP